jgi:predicted NBD/HSP70 family sugar kinase
VHPSYLRQFHASQIFHALRARPDISQRELGEVTGCDKSTVSVIVKRFEELGLVERRQGESRGQRGRPVERLRISKQSGLLVGVHLEFDCLRFVAAGIDGIPVGSVDAPLPRQPAQLAAAVRDGIGRICKTIGRKRADIHSVGVCVPGLIGAGGGLAHSPKLRWNDVAVLDLLRDEIGAPVHVDNDSNATALAEYLFGECASLDDFILIDGGLGIGGGLFLDGRLYRGKTGFSGEIGHMKVVKDGRLCECGGLGCLSAYLSTAALLERATRVRPQASSMEAVEALARDGDVAIRGVLNEAGGFLGLALANLVNIFNPPALVLAGTVAQLWPYLKAAARLSLEENALSAPLGEVEIIASKLSLADVPRGGVAIALEGFSSLDRPEATPW